jgi:HlyD family secretion protein
MGKLGTTVSALAIAGLAIAGWEVAQTIRAPEPPLDDRPAAAATNTARPASGKVTALGRLEPRDGPIRVAGPSRPSVVLSSLLVDEGDEVKAGQKLAVLDTHAAQQRQIERLAAELTNAEAEARRHEPLHRRGMESESLWDTRRTNVDVARASLRQAEAELEMSLVRSPIDGRVLEVFARAGERVGPQGILEVGRTHEMFAVAQVYETDVPRVRLGQRATVTSPALTEPLQGSVAKIHPKVGKQDVLGTDPAARADARVVEVEIQLDDSNRAAGFTNLEVDIEIAS